MNRLLETALSLAGLNGRGRRPRVMTYTVTFRCNARCLMCDSWRIPRQDELRIDELERILPGVPQLDFVRLTGGEPFVRKDLLAIAELIQEHQRPRMLHVTTNGFLTERVVDFAERRSKRTPLHLLVSIDGVEGKHDEVRNVPEAWNRAIATLEALAPRRAELSLKLAVNQTVLDAGGASHYRPLRRALERLDVKNHLVVAYAESATYSVERDQDKAPVEAGAYSTFGHFSRASLAALLDQAEEDLAELPIAERIAKSYYLAGLRARLLEEGRDRGPRCVALHSHLRLFPNGDVPTCQFNSKAVGNLRHETFDEVWGGEAAAASRDWVARCPGCWAECEVLPSAAYTGALLAHAARSPRVLAGRRAKRAAPAPVSTGAPSPAPAPTPQ